MEIIFYIVFFLFGILIDRFILRKEEVHGKVYIDEKTGLCRFKLESDDIANLKTKKAVFKIYHNSRVSRDEHTL